MTTYETERNVEDSLEKARKEFKMTTTYQPEGPLYHDMEDALKAARKGYEKGLYPNDPSELPVMLQIAIYSEDGEELYDASFNTYDGDLANWADDEETIRAAYYDFELDLSNWEDEFTIQL